MGFGLGDIASIGLGGPLGYGIYKGLTGGGSSDVAQVPLETPEQRQARAGLLGFAKTGSYGNYTAGTPYTGSLGDFAISSLERSGLNDVTSRLSSGPGSLFDLGSASLNDLLATDKYNPLNEKGMIQGLTGAIDYNTKLASDAARRESGYAGSLYSTDAVRKLGNVQAQGANTKATTLAGLYQNYLSQKFGAIPQAFAANAQAEDIARGRTADAFQYGGLERNLRTAEDQAKYAEFQRQQQEKQGQISALSSVAGTNSNFGVPSVSIPKNNPWMDVLSLLAQFGGKYAGVAAGRA